MQKRFSALFIAIAAAVGAASTSAQAAELLKMRVNVQQEKRNAVIHFSKAAIGQVAVPSDADYNAFIGVTSDFGDSIPAYVVFKTMMSLEDGLKYAEHQGAIHGEARCELVQKGNSPDAPAIGVAVLAQNCTIISAKY